MPKQFLTIKQVAEIIQVHPQTVYYWTYMKRIPFVKLNGTIRIPRGEFEEWVKNGRNSL